MEKQNKQITLAEINLYIATEVMFWKLLPEDIRERIEPELLFFHNAGGISVGIGSDWNPWQNIEHTMRMLEMKFKSPTYSWSIYKWTSDFYEFTLADMNLRGKVITERGPVLAQIICIAALKNYGKWPEEGIEVIE